MVEDAELLRRYADERSEAAFAELVQRHLDLVYSAALRRLGGDAHAAADVTQRVFTLLARQAASLVRWRVLPGWLYATTRNVAANHVRSERRRRAREQEAHLMHELNSNSAPSESADWTRLRPALDAVMDALGERDREAVLLRFFARRPFAEVGAALKISEDAARMRVERALEKLRGMLAQRGVTSTASALAVALTEQSVLAAPAGLAATVASSAAAAGVAVGSAAASASAAGILAGSIGFMSTSKLPVGLVGLALIGTFAGALREMRVGQRSEAAVAAATLDNEALAARLRALRTQSETAKAAAPPVQRAAESSAAAGNRSEVETSAYLARHPDLHAALRQEGRARVAGQFAAFFRPHRLSPEQIERALDLIPLAWGMGYSFEGTNGAQLQYRATNAERAAARRELRALLGEELFRELPFFEPGSPLGRMPTELAAALYYTPTPLTAEQADRFQQILGDRYVRPDPTSPKALAWDAVMRDAASVLSEAQMAVLRHLRSLDETDKALFTIR